LAYGVSSKNFDRIFFFKLFFFFFFFKKNSWSHHLHYDLEFRGLKVSESSKKAWQEKWAYAHFGAVACALELVPILNILFVWTNFIGSALWIADVYEKEHKVAAETIYPVAQAASTDENAPLLANEEGEGYDTV
jgi:hypothetical protein